MRRGAPRLGVLGCTRPLVHGFGPTRFSSLGVNRSHMSSSCRFVLIHIALQSELGRYLLHGDDRYAVVSSRQRNTMTRAAWGTARFPSFSVSRLPRFQAGTVTRAAAPSLLLSLILEVLFILRCC